MFERDYFEVQVTGEPRTRGDTLAWVHAIYAVLTDEQQKIVRQHIRTIAARRDTTPAPPAAPASPARS
jgi:hypothetical protein